MVQRSSHFNLALAQFLRKITHRFYASPKYIKDKWKIRNTQLHKYYIYIQQHNLLIWIFRYIFQPDVHLLQSQHPSVPPLCNGEAICTVHFTCTGAHWLQCNVIRQEVLRADIKLNVYTIVIKAFQISFGTKGCRRTEAAGGVMQWNSKSCLCHRLEQHWLVFGCSRLYVIRLDDNLVENEQWASSVLFLLSDWDNVQ